MAGFCVDIQLEVLVVVEEATPLFEDSQVVRIKLFQHISVITAGDLRLGFYDLAVNLGASHCDRVTPAICKNGYGPSIRS